MASREEVQEINITDVSVEYIISSGYVYCVNFMPSFILGQDERINIVIENSSGLYINRNIIADNLSNWGNVLESVPVGPSGVLYNSVIVTITVFAKSQTKVFRSPNMNVTKRE